MKGSKIPDRVMREIQNDPFYEKCARHDEGNCAGRLTLEHAVTYAGKNVQEVFAIIPLCEYHHAVGIFQDGGDLDKNKNREIALSRAMEEDKQKYPRLWDLLG